MKLNQAYEIIPSILNANFARLGEEIRTVLNAGVRSIHLDIMDNHYVPNLTFGPWIMKALKKEGIKAFMDVHLMVKPVDDLIKASIEAGAHRIVFHPDASNDLNRSLELIKSKGCLAGLALNPADSLTELDAVLSSLDVLLLMSVNPGFGGQRFIPSVLEKISAAHQWIIKKGYVIPIAVDGGINLDNIADVAAAGASIFIVGSAIFNSTDYDQSIQKLRNQLKGKL